MRIRIFFAALAACFALALSASPASAQATRTWVSGVGDDANPCSRTAPCKTFAGAISKTAAGGEINCLDPAGYGAVTITKSITIDCHYTEGGALASGNAIVVNAAATDVIVLRGLDFLGVNPPTNGVRFLAGGTLIIENSVIRRFNAANSFGVSFTPSGTSRLIMNDVLVANNGNGATGGGVQVQPSGAGVANAEFNNVRVVDNANAGLFISGAATVMIANSDISHNVAFGIRTSGGAPAVRVGSSVITNNGTGISLAAGTIESYCTNQLNGNGTDGGFFPAACLALK